MSEAPEASTQHVQQPASPISRSAVGPRGLWVLVGLTLAGLVGASVAVRAGAGRGNAPPFVTGTSRAPTPGQRLPAPDPMRLRLAGSGTNLPLTRALAKAFTASHPGTRVIVHGSIGSSGGARATGDGVIDLGLVSRPLTAAERSRGLTALPYARVAVVLAAHPTVPDVALDRAALLRLYRGERATWSNGRPVHVLQREAGDSGHRAVNRVLPRFATVNDRARRARRWRVAYRDRALQEALLSTPGAVGLFDLGAMVSQRLYLKVLPFEGRRPSARDPLPAGYPLYKDLAFVFRPPLHGLARDFVTWVRGPAGAATIGRLGYRPVGGPAP